MGKCLFVKIQVMKHYDMCEALYALPDGVIRPRRKPLTIPLLLTIAGVVMLVVNSMISAETEYANIKSAIVLFGAVFVVVGIVLCAVRLGGNSCAPWHVQDGCFLKKEELKFVKERSSHVRDLVRKGDFATLRSLPEDGVSAVTVVVYSSPRGGFCAAQVFEYVDLEQQPVTDIKVMM